MWGISFDDMAKKAAELQEQAAHAAESLAHSTPVANFSSSKAFFNLDGIQKQEEEKESASKATRAVTTTLTTPTPANKKANNVTEQSTTTNAVKMNEEPVPKAAEPLPPHHGMESLPVVSKESQDVTGPALDDIPAAQPADGWGDDDLEVDAISDDDGAETEQESTAIATSDDVSDENAVVAAEDMEAEAPQHEQFTNGDAARSQADGDELATNMEMTEEAPEIAQPSASQDELPSAVTEEAVTEATPALILEHLPQDGPVLEQSTETDPVVAASTESETRVPDHVLENFSLQLKRLEENFAAERNEMLQQHALQVDQLKASFTHDECQAERTRLEDSYNQQIIKLEERLHDVGRKNEGCRLKIDMLQREVDGTKLLLEERDGNVGKTQEEHCSIVKSLQEKLLAEQCKSSQYELDVKRLNENIATAKKDADSQQKQHAELKERMKSLALELKDRRQECRQLKLQVESQNESNERLQSEVDSLRLQLSNHGLTSTEKHEEMEQMKAQLVDAQEEIKKAAKALTDQQAQADKVLSDYKKKAQNSLALSNSRAAAAVQAKEEAELEARSARSTADSAMDKAVQAELIAKKQVAEARHYMQEMEMDKATALEERNKANGRLADVEMELEKIDCQFKESETVREQFAIDLQKALAASREQAALALNLSAELDDTRRKESSLRQDLSTAREEVQQLQKSLAAVQAASPPPLSEEQQTKPKLAKTSSSSDSVAKSTIDEETLALFQRELQEARESSEELKHALASLIAENETLKQLRQTGAVGQNVSAPSRSISGDAESTPLFYAIEKQAELRTARDEIARLANFLSKVQSEKSEAEEMVALLRQRAQDTETRLKLFEKFGRQSESDLDKAANGKRISQPNDSSIVNIEYLKNIMLRYLNAKSVKEKKALVPAIGAVLEFTSDEQRTAVENVEQGASLGGVSSSLFETISFKLGS